MSGSLPMRIIIKDVEFSINLPIDGEKFDDLK